MVASIVDKFIAEVVGGALQKMMRDDEANYERIMGRRKMPCISHRRIRQVPGRNYLYIPIRILHYTLSVFGVKPAVFIDLPIH